MLHISDHFLNDLQYGVQFVGSCVVVLGSVLGYRLVLVPPSDESEKGRGSPLSPGRTHPRSIPTNTCPHSRNLNLGRPPIPSRQF